MGAEFIFPHGPQGDRGDSSVGTRYWKQPLSRQGLRGRLEDWWLRLIGDEDSQERSDALPAQGALLRRWSPFFVPFVLGVLAVVGALTVIVRQWMAPSELLVNGGPAEFIAVALIFGALFGVLLYVAPTPRIWMATMLAGSLLYVALLLAVSLGLLLGLLLVGGAALVLFIYVRSHLWLVPDDVVVPIVQRDRYVRTIYPGLNVLWPLERPLGTLSTGLHIYTSPQSEVRRTTPTGIPYRVSASAVVAYALIPAEAGRAVDMIETWEGDLHQIVDVTLRDALQDWSHREIEEGGAVCDNSVARAVLEQVREDAREFGVWVSWVRICHIRVRRVLPEAPSPAVSHPGSESWAVAVASASGGAHTGVNRPKVAAKRSPNAVARAQARMLGEIIASEGHDIPNEVEHDPNALSDLYDAVRAGTVTDPDTIRSIAREFSEIAASPDLSAACDFSPEMAADLLTAYAAKLEAYQRANRTSMPSWPSDPRLQAVHTYEADLVLR